MRYQGSLLGYSWSLLRPLLMFVILYIVFVHFLRFKSDIPNYSIYLLLGIILWNFFAETTSLSLSSIVSRGEIIRKIRIPRWTIVISSSISALINLFLSLVIVGIFMIIKHVDLHTSALLFPLVLVQLYIFSLGLAFLLATLYVKYRDVSYIWEVVLQAAFYITPVIYPLSLITNVYYQKLLLLNPVATAVQDGRYTIVSHQTTTTSAIIHSPWVLLIPYVLSVLFLVAGVLYFKKEAKNFAENL